MKLVPRIGWMLARPKRVFAVVKEEKPGKAWLYFLLVISLSIIPLMIAGWIIFERFFAPIFQGLPIFWMRLVFIILMPLSVYFMLALILLFDALFLTIGLKILRTKIKLSQSINVVFYGATPLTLTFWLPPIMIVAAIWSLVLVVRGYKLMYDIPHQKAIAVILFFVALAGIQGLLLRLLTS